MDFASLMEARYSARAYLADPVPEDTLKRIFALAQKTPSWCNVQPWEVVVTADVAATERFRQALWAYVQEGHVPKPDFPFPGKYIGEYRERRKRCGAALYGALGIPREDKRGAMQQTLKNFRLFDAPHVMLVFSHESLGVYGAIDCGLYLQSFLLASLNEGVQTVPQAALATYPDFIRQYFKVSGEYRLLFGCSFGYADESDPVNRYRTERAPVDESVRWVGG